MTPRATGGAPRQHPLAGILVKLLLAYAVPALALFAVFAYVAYDLTRSDLDAELGRRLSGIAGAAAVQVRGKFLVSAQRAPDGTLPRVFEQTRQRLEQARAATGSARLTVLARGGATLVDTGGAEFGVAKAEIALDRHELGRVFDDGQAVASVLFQGSDKRYYKAGYAPVYADPTEGDHTIVAALRVEAPAGFFARLATLRARLITAGGALASVVILASVVVAIRLTRPLRRLSAAAERIGRGDLAAPVDVRATDEIGVLARTLDEMREALRARDERLQMMLAGIAHEVRNPLGGIELYAGILREELPETDERRPHVAKIERELAHLKAVVNDFLEYARRPKPELRAVEVDPLLAEIRDVVSADAQAAAVTIAVSVDPGAPALRVSADRTQLRRALLNLTRNAIQATPEGGTVSLSAAVAPAGRVLLRVSDTGKGIAPENSAKIFTPFYTTKEKGTGLGLAFVREIVADHGGTLSLDSEPGHGATFTMSLPSA